eukprot:CAMPEP_0184289338 /NCGR_PEP_ID=MMETSP1049-20130417/1793_1 /TAXON_ID=77928 /ORGANISM="Proteomonas sulcata, Strain CCMP704" /LENGTH=232 /DNA_ID=CAMNT_0026596089 /DNA_START=157 /DNA_END=855 /DNA_ORIENTATION=-
MDSRQQLVGWGSGQARPTKGLRVRMAPGFADQGTGTVLAIKNISITQPIVTVKWDGGRKEDFASGATISRNACHRSRHPEPTDEKVIQWIRNQGWDPRDFNNVEIDTLLLFTTHDLEKMLDLPEGSVAKEQLKGLRRFCKEAMDSEDPERNRLRIKASGPGHDLAFWGSSGSALPLTIATRTAGLIQSPKDHSIGQSYNRAIVRPVTGSATQALDSRYPRTANRLLYTGSKG